MEWSIITLRVSSIDNFLISTSQINSCLQVTLFGVVWISLEEHRSWEPVFENHFYIFHGWVQKVLECLISWIILVALVFPKFNLRSEPSDNLEVCVQKENNIVLHGCIVKSNWLGSRILNIIRENSWLNHNKTVWDIFSVECASIVGNDIWRHTECLCEMTSSEMIHELRVQGEVIA